jgi:hypothetical protein
MSPDIVLAVVAGGVFIVLFALYNLLGSGYTNKTLPSAAEKKKKAPLVVAGPYSRYVCTTYCVGVWNGGFI